ncbi:MAG: hypothetical protein JXA09_00030 [Anaerolineae bacterium]|nr:hypothetical protein [Anaerolineae bacterium]
MVQDGRYARYRGQYAHVYWIGGGSCSGKSSIADALGLEYGWDVLHTDRLAGRVWAQADPERHPSAARIAPAMRDFVMWMQLPTDQLFAASYEVFELLLDMLPPYGGRPLVVEGMGVHMGAVAEFADIEQVVCLVGSDAFLRTVEPQHPFVKRYYSEWQDPEHRLAILIEGHIRITHAITNAADMLGVRQIVVDECTGREAVYGMVKAHFCLA